MKPVERLTEFQIRDYSKKIFGFALGKTGTTGFAATPGPIMFPRKKGIGERPI